MIECWDDPPSFRGIAETGREYDVFVTDKTKIDAGTDEQLTWDDLKRGDFVKVWLNRISKNPEPDPAHYEAIRIDTGLLW